MKVTGALPGVTGGVSQLPPGDRQPGQCAEQVNFLSDRTRGLARRPGSQWQGERPLGAQPPASHTDATRWRTAPWRTANGEYTALVRTAAVEPGCPLPGLQVYSHASKSFLPVVRGVDADLDTLFSGGCSAVTAVGAYLFLAGNDTVPRGSSFDAVLDPAFARKSVVWVRGGVFDREYSVMATVAGAQTAVSFSTPAAAYPYALDTSDIPATIPGESGSDNFTVTAQVAREAAYSRLQLSNWPVGAVGYVSQVVHADGSIVLPTTDPFPLPGEWVTRIDPGTGAAFVRMNAAELGRKFKVTYIRDAAPGSESTVKTVESVTATFGDEPAGVVRLDFTPLTVTVAGFTVDTGGEPAPGHVRWHGGAPSTLVFNSTAIGSDVVVSGTRPKTVPNPDYQRLVDNATLAHNRAVTAYMLEAAAKIKPEYIAGQLVAMLRAEGLTAEQHGGHLYVDAEQVSVRDGGDGALMRAVDTEVAAVEDLTDLHFVGKVVRVRPVAADSAYYVKATAKADGAVGLTEVVWVETAGVLHTVEHALCYALVVGGTCYVASSATKLAALTAGAHPEFKQSTAGDAVSSPLPAFIGKRITMLATFQDRLIVGTGGTLCISAASDYLRFMPSSVVTVPADSGFEVSAQGSDTDVLRQAVLYGRDLLIFGDQKQYAVSGKAALTPTGVSLAVVSTVPGAAAVGPVAVGGLLLFASEGERGTAVSQMQPGLDPDNPSVTSVSAALADYLTGAPQELARRGNPDTLYLRTKGAPRSIFQFRFEDTPRGRETASWSRWEFDPALGTVLGVSATQQGVLVFFLRDAGADTYLVADLCSEDAAQSPRPYTDSQRPLAQVLAGGSVTASSSGPWIAAYTSASTRYLIGDTLSKLGELRLLYGDAGLVVGCNQPTQYVMTNPYPRDRDGRPNRGARLTVTSVKVVAADSSGLVATLATPTGESSRTFLSRSVQDLGLIGRVPVGDWSQQVAVAKWNEGYTMTLSALRWYPLTITALDWTGQLFQRAQRI